MENWGMDKASDSCRLNLVAGEVTRQNVTAGIVNPSYLARDPANPFLYVASESFRLSSRVLSYQIGADGHSSPRYPMNLPMAARIAMFTAMETSCSPPPTSTGTWASIRLSRVG